MSFSKIYDFTLAAGGSTVILVEGDYARIMSSTGPVELVTDAYRIGPIIAGQGQRNSKFRRMVINDKSGSANIGTILIADSDFVDQTILGAVSVIDGEKSRTLAGGMFSGSPNCTPGAAANAIVQLWNPAASGKNLVVGSLELVAPAAGALTGLVYTVAATSPTDVTAGRAANNLSGGSIGVGQVRIDTASGIPGVFANNLLRTMSAPASAAAGWKIRGAVVVPPGKGLTVAATSVNLQMIVNFEWFEEAVM